MKFFLFSSLLLTASASTSLLSASPNGENESPTNVTSPFVKVRNVCIATVRRYSTPASAFIGTSDKLLRCLVEDPEQCEVWYTTGSKVRSLLVVGEYIYAGLHGKLLRCHLNQAESCMVYQTCDTFVNSLATVNGNLYVGLENKTALICGLHEINSCRPFRIFENAVYALVVVNEYIFVGLWNGKVMRCSLGIDSSCTHMYTIGSISRGITGFTNAGNSFFATSYRNNLWKCVGKSDANDAIDSCESVPLSYFDPTDIALFDGVLYTVELNGNVYICQWANNTNCTKYGNINNAIAITFSYATYQMQSRYRNEDTACTWQSECQCPPHVTYYDAQQRAKLEVHVKDGKLYNSQGTLVDTSDADAGHPGSAAIFAMGSGGRILLSNSHKKGLLHTSSFFAGKPVAGAGEMVVKNGQIQEIRACSEHYLPDTELNRQVIQSLKAQGYTDHIKSVMCSESDYI